MLDLKRATLAVQIGVFIASSGFYFSSANAGEEPGFPLDEHIDQFRIHEYSFRDLYYSGEKLFSAPFNALDGVGSNLDLSPVDPETKAVKKRFTRSPRPDLPGWLANVRRPDGPQAQNCVECHNERNGNVLNEQRDAFRMGDISMWIERQTTNLSGAGALQLLAEQSSKELWAIRDSALQEAASTGVPVSKELLTSNDVSYGYLTAYPDGTLDTDEVEGISTEDAPLIFTKALGISPYHLKGIVSFMRFFVAGSTDVTVGMQSPERYPPDMDQDSDGVINELSTGDITAMTLFIAAQPRPVTKLELHENIGGKFRLSRQEIKSIRRGEELFADIGCAGCHKPVLHLKNAVFSEPSSTPGFHFPIFWVNMINPDLTISGDDPLNYGYDLDNPVRFDLTKLPDARCRKWRKRGNISGAFYDFISWRDKPNRCFLQFEADGAGGAYVRLYGDQKRHYMGEGLDEPIVEFGVPEWRTKELWGVGSTGPWLHDGRATTLTEAIYWHGGEGEDSKNEFFALGETQQDNVRAFLKNLVVYDPKRNEIR